MLTKFNVTFHIVERVLWRDFGSSKDVDGVLSISSEKKKKHIVRWRTEKRHSTITSQGFFFKLIKF